MKKVTKEYNVYKFEELEKDIQEKVLEKHVEFAYQDYLDYYFYDDMYDLARNLLHKHFKGANYNKIYYELSYSQVSGSMIEFNIDLKDLNEKYKMLDIEELNKCIKIGFTKITIKHDNSNYCHEYTFDIDWNDYTDYDDFEEIQDKIDNMIEKFKEDIVDMNKELTESGYKQLEDKEYFEELARINMVDLEFLENGDEFYE